MSKESSHRGARVVLALGLASVWGAACGGQTTAVSSMRTVVIPPRPPDCALQLVTVAPADMAPGANFGAGGKYQMVGVVGLGLPRGTDVLSPRVRELVRPRACAMGGEVVSIIGTGDATYDVAGQPGRTHDQTNVTFTVWGPAAAVAGPKAF